MNARTAITTSAPVPTAAHAQAGGPTDEEDESALLVGDEESIGLEASSLFSDTMEKPLVK